MANIRREFFIQSALAMKSGEYTKAFGYLRGRRNGGGFDHCGLGVMADVSIRNDPESVYRWDDEGFQSALRGRLGGNVLQAVKSKVSSLFGWHHQADGGYEFASGGGLGQFVYKGIVVMSEGFPFREDGRSGWTVSQEFWDNLPAKVKRVIDSDYRQQPDGTVDILGAIPSLNDWTNPENSLEHISLSEIADIVLEHARIMEPEDEDAVMPDLTATESNFDLDALIVEEAEKEPVSG